MHAFLYELATILFLRASPVVAGVLVAGRCSFGHYFHSDGPFCDDFACDLVLASLACKLSSNFSLNLVLVFLPP